MTIDLEYVRRHYASLSDEGLAAVDRDELVEAAQKCYDEECAKRRSLPKQQIEDEADEEVLEPELDTEDDNEGDQPEWLEAAACVCAFADFAQNQAAQDAAHARSVLKAERIPCYIAREEIPTQGAQAGHVQVEYRVLVPGALNLMAVSVLDREIFNPQLAAQWTAHLEALSDEEIQHLNPDIICAGLRDRIERLTHAFEAELARRNRN